MGIEKLFDSDEGLLKYLDSRADSIYDINIYGSENIPSESNYAIIANHIDTFDPALITYAVLKEDAKRLHYLAKNDIEKMPLIGNLAKKFGLIFVPRPKDVEKIGKREYMKKIKEIQDEIIPYYLEKGEPIGVAYAGTRTTNFAPTEESLEREIEQSKDFFGLYSYFSEGTKIIPTAIEIYKKPVRNKVWDTLTSIGIVYGITSKIYSTFNLEKIPVDIYFGEPISLENYLGPRGKVVGPKKAELGTKVITNVYNLKKELSEINIDDKNRQIKKYFE